MAIRTGRPPRELLPAAQLRRRELAEAAAAQFHRLGFHRVVLADVAAAVGVTAPAVYRHFRNKNALLAGAISTGLDHIEAALDGAASLEEALHRLAEAALARPDVWALLQREIRHLDDRARREATHRFRLLAERFTEHVRAARPDLDEGRHQILATAAYAVLATPSTRPSPLPYDICRAVLARSAAAACATRLPDDPPPARVRRPRGRAAREEQILSAAIALFHRHGYAAVTMEDLGAAAGIAAPSIYHYFPTKADLLLAAYARAEALLPAAALPLRELVERYATLAVGERVLFGVYVTEEINLPAAAAEPIRRAMAADTDRWVAALRARRPDVEPLHAALLVDAARSTVHDLTRVGRLHTRPGITGEITAVALAVLDAG